MPSCESYRAFAMKDFNSEEDTLKVVTACVK